MNEPNLYVVEVDDLPDPYSVVEVYVAGAPGAPGGVGAGSGDKYYKHDQTVASATWSIQHNLGKFPAVTVVDSAGSTVEGDISYVDNTRVNLTFSGAFAGTAYLN